MVALMQGMVNAMFSARFRVEGDSMLPTLRHGQSVLVVRPNFPWNRLRRGDIVVMNRPGPPPGTYIKRVIALPDEEIKVEGGRCYVDDLVVSTIQDVTASERSRWWNGSDELFVLGDNPALSTDSRAFGPVPADLIVGRVWLRCWPPRDFGRVR